MDEDFIRWVQEKQPADEAFWNNWLRNYPEKHLLIAEARRILESIRVEQRVFTEQEIEQETNKLLQTITGQPKGAGHTQQARIRFINRRYWLAAAAIAGLILLGIKFIPFAKDVKPLVRTANFTYSKQIAQRQLIEQVNTTDKPINILLADSSLVELSVNSRISYPRNFDSAGTRDVYLSGEAFFKVTKNPNMPFRVYANELVTKVLGTSFKVVSFEKDSVIQVIVKTGKVSVYSQVTTPVQETTATKLGGIILTPNQKLTYKKEGQQFEKVLLQHPSLIVSANVDRNMIYEDSRVEEVFEQISKAYGINIVYDNDLLKNCTVTADLRNESFYDKLDLVCRAIGAGYEVIDGQVVIQTAGCQ